MYSYLFLSAFLITTFALQWWQRSAYPIECWIALLSCGLVAMATTLFRSSRRHAIGILAATAGTSIAFSAVGQATYVPDSTSIDAFADQKNIVVEGIVADQPDDRQTKIQYTIETESIRLAKTGAVVPVHGKLLLIDRSASSTFAPGDRLSVPGTIKIPLENKDFSYKAFLELSDIHATIDSREMTLIEHTSKHRLTRLLWIIRRWFENRIAIIFPEPSASLLAGLLTGTKQGLPTSITDAFRTTGLSHIVAISGSNITIIIGIMTGMLFFLPLRWRFIPSIIVITLFTLFVGAGASVIRAAIMGILGILALHTGRLPNARLSVLWTAFFMLIWNPAQLWLDAGFQLSFLAVIGLVELQPILKHYCANLPEEFGMKDALMTTIAAQLTAMPWSAFRFGLFSLISPIANVFVGPLIPLAMLMGFAGTVAGMIHPLIGKIIGFPAVVLLELIIGLTEFFAAIPYAAINIPRAGWMLSCAYYLLLTGATTMLKRRLPSVQKH